MDPIKSLKINPMINNKGLINNNYWKFSNDILTNKYCTYKYSYSNLCINCLFLNKKSRIVSRFKDFLLYDDNTEYLLLIYKDELLRKTSINVFNFYEHFNKAFPNYMILPENKYMYKNLRKKQRMINEINKMMLQKQREEKGVNINLNNDNNNKININIFDDKAKEAINRENNTLLTTSLADTIISNYINNDDSKKNESIIDNSSFIESNINSSSVNIYTKRPIIKKNGNDSNNRILYNNTKKSLSSLQSFVDCLNNKKYKKIYVNHQNNKYKLLNIDIISNNNQRINNRNSNRASNFFNKHFKTLNRSIKASLDNKLFKRDKDSRQLSLYHHTTLNNNKKRIFSNTKITSDTEYFSKRKTTKFNNNFNKEYSRTMFVNSSLIGKSKSRQKNVIKKRSEDIRNLVHNSISKNRVNTAKSSDNNERCRSKDIKNSQDKKIKKVNNYFTFKKIYKKNDSVKYNKTIYAKKQKKEEENNNNDDNNKEDKIYEIFEQKFRSTLYRKIRRKKRPIFEADSTESTKLSFNIRKPKFNLYMTCDKMNYSSNNHSLVYNNKNNANKENKEVLNTQLKEETIVNNNYDTFNNAKKETGVYNHYKYRKKRIIFQNNNNTLYEKNKAYYVQTDNNNDSIHSSVNKKHVIDDNKMIYLDYKLKKIQEEIVRNKNNYIEIKEKYRKLSLNNNKKIFNYNVAAPSCQNKKYEKIERRSLLYSNSVENKRRNNNFNSNNINKNIKNEINARIKSKDAKKEKNTIIHMHQRILSLINNDNKSPIGRNAKKVLIKGINSKNQDSSASNKAEKRIYRKIENVTK